MSASKETMKICHTVIAASRFLLVMIIINNINTLSIVDKGILPLTKNSVALQFYIDIENNSRLKLCTVHASHQKCCLAGQEKDICRVLDIYPPSDDIIKPRDRRTFLYISPLIHQHDLEGHCTFEIEYQCNTKFDKLNAILPFDTRVHECPKKLFGDYLRNEKISACDTLDQDSLDSCLPVHCDLKYLGHRIHYKNKCVDIPICIGNLYKELPDIVYVPDSNLCRNLEMPITLEDVYAITSGLGIATQTTTEDNTYVEVKSNCSTISQNINLIRDLMYGRLYPYTKGKITDFSKCFTSAILTIIFCIISITAVLFSFICCVKTTLWLYKQGSDGEIKKHWQCVKRRFKRKQKCKDKSVTDKEVRNALLKEVIVKDIPMELRDSVVNICDRMEKEVCKRQRYRKEDIGSQISLLHGSSPVESDGEE
ncbi:unnamed protein product [Pieris brassicae]|uniref:Uncharacterized protein n=1 Tax=Pieris brassicae TaxID=7116 RepID=A0A9P0T4U6_PIEBR|nr:unnamed protein product [Pieris brassicae]